MSNAYPLDTGRWLAATGAGAFNPQLWYMGKVPFANAVFQEAAADIRAGLEALSGRSRKLIVLDLDDTMWGGIVGDVGVEQIKLGEHDPIGEAFVDFQNTLRTRRNRGILLAIVSKNEHDIAMQAIAEHLEMVLRPHDFVGWRINWRDKAQNILELVEELNLGLQSVVFIDDNPAERARVAEALPEALVPDWPRDVASHWLNRRVFRPRRRHYFIRPRHGNRALHDCLDQMRLHYRDGDLMFT